MSGYYGFGAYVSVAEKRAKADRMAAKLRKKNPDLQPVVLEGKTIAESWWGNAWIRNLESYADYKNRISRGKSYVRNHAVLDLNIGEGHVDALVMGSSSKPYAVAVDMDVLEEKRWKQVVNLCNHRIDSVEQLTMGKFPKELADLFKEKDYGLFPAPGEIHFHCSCPDYAYMCKHVAAVLYGIGARLDLDPLLFFTLRGTDIQELIRRSVENRMESMLKNSGKKSGRTLSEEEMHRVFGI